MRVRSGLRFVVAAGCALFVGLACLGAPVAQGQAAAGAGNAPPQSNQPPNGSAGQSANPTGNPARNPNANPNANPTGNSGANPIAKPSAGRTLAGAPARGQAGAPVGTQGFTRPQYPAQPQGATGRTPSAPPAAAQQPVAQTPQNALPAKAAGAASGANPASQPFDAPWPQRGTIAMRDVLLIEGFCVLAVLLVLYPIFRYLLRQWQFRRDRLFGAMSGDAAVYYYLQFRQGSDMLKDYLPHKLTEDEWKKQKQEQGIDCWFDPVTQTRYLLAFKRDFYRWYGRRYYIAPLAMLVMLTLLSGFWAQKMLRGWAMHSGPDKTLRALAASALAGAFVWIVSDEIDRLRRRDFTTSDVYYYVFRILLAIPFAWALSMGKEFSLDTAIPIAFFLGAFPTSTLFLIARRLGSRWLKLGDDPKEGVLDLEGLQSIGKSNAERYKDEGVATISTLAYFDPIDLTIRTNFDFNYVVDCVSQALAWIYFEEKCKDLAPYAMRGAQEIVSITRSADDVRYPVQQALAQKSIQEAAAKLGIDPAAFRTTLDQIAQDPYSVFLVNIWD